MLVILSGSRFSKAHCLDTWIPKRDAAIRNLHNVLKDALKQLLQGERQGKVTPCPLKTSLDRGWHKNNVFCNWMVPLQRKNFFVCRIRHVSMVKLLVIKRALDTQSLLCDGVIEQQRGAAYRIITVSNWLKYERLYSFYTSRTLVSWWWHYNSSHYCVFGLETVPSTQFYRIAFSAIISCNLKYVCVVQGKNSALIQCKQKKNKSESFPSRILMSHL